MRYIERHCGVAVIKDNSLLPQALEKLAKYEDEEEQDMKDLQRLGIEEYIMQRFMNVN
ncbi:MAG: hypothetical protein ACI4D9_01690 [Lachnospiraceae bacterium]